MPKKLAFSVTIKDCRVDEFRAGGPGGQNQNKRNTGIRVVHEPSGAVGESREERSQLQNKKTAFRRMAQSPKFKIWVNQRLYGLSEDAAPQETARALLRASKEPVAFEEKDVLVEVRENGRWVQKDI